MTAATFTFSAMKHGPLPLNRCLAKAQSAMDSIQAVAAVAAVGVAAAAIYSSAGQDVKQKTDLRRAGLLEGT